MCVFLSMVILRWKLSIWCFLCSWLKIETAWKKRLGQAAQPSMVVRKVVYLYIVLEHSNSTEDRRFDFDCRQVSSDLGLTSWSWSGTDVCLYIIQLVCYPQVQHECCYTYKIQHLKHCKGISIKKNIHFYACSCFPFFQENYKYFNSHFFLTTFVLSFEIMAATIYCLFDFCYTLIEI